MNKRAVRWLYDELPRLVSAGVLDAASAERLRAHYGVAPGRRAGQLAMLIFGVLGALVAVGLYLALSDRPRTLGLPPVAEWRNDHAGAPSRVNAARSKYFFAKSIMTESDVAAICGYALSA